MSDCPKLSVSCGRCIKGGCHNCIEFWIARIREELKSVKKAKLIYLELKYPNEK